MRYERNQILKFSAGHREIRRTGRPIRAGQWFLRRPARLLVVAAAALGLAVAAVGAAAAGSRDGSLVITKDGTVVDGRQITGYLQVKANNVTIKNSIVRSGGDAAVHVLDGFAGTRIEDTKIYCLTRKTDGIVSGNYTARKVRTFGCRRGFIYSASAPATITGSTWNGKPVTTEAAVTTGAEAAATTGAAAAPGAASPAAESGSGTAPRVTAAGVIPTSFPGAANTGVPAGTPLKASGSIVAAKAGQVISGLNINGCVTVTAPNVTIRKSRITCGQNYSILNRAVATNLLVEDVEIDGMGRNGAAVCCTSYTLRRVDISNVLDGPRLGDNTVVEDSWIHHLTRVSGSHNDAMQTTGASNVVVRGNSLEAYNPVTRDPNNACLMIGSTSAPLVSNLVFEQNYCNGGNYSMGIRTDLRAVNIKIQNNTYGHDYRYGVIARPDQAGILWVKSTNVWMDSRTPVLR
jgi:hypothetical protein